MDEPYQFKNFGGTGGPAKPLMAHHHRGQHKPAPKEHGARRKQEKVERVVRQYTDGILTSNEFKR